MKTVAEIRSILRGADRGEYEVLRHALSSDPRKGVRQALEAAAKRLDSEDAELERVSGLYRFERELAGGALAVGLDEVGRGPLAGPLTVGAVVLPGDLPIPGINDSKQLSPERRENLAEQVRKHAVAWEVVHASPQKIDELGMARTLRDTFGEAIARIDAKVAGIGAVLIDGNPLNIDAREINVVKGDALCASIAAASILAKVVRDAIMVEYARQYPEYGFESCKGYGSRKHMDAIREFGLTPIHRRSFCHIPEQGTLF